MKVAPLRVNLLESVYPLCAAFVILLIGLSLWAASPICSLGRPLLPQGMNPDFLVTRDTVIEISIRDQEIVLDGSRATWESVARTLLTARRVGRRVRLTVAADGRRPFDAVKRALSVAQDAGFESSMLLADRFAFSPVPRR